MDNEKQITRKGQNVPTASQTSSTQQIASYKPQSITTTREAIDAQTPTLAKIRGEKGLPVAYAVIVREIGWLSANLNIGKNMNATQIATAAEIIYENYYFFRPEDFRLCFRRMLAGEYGAIYDRLDIGVLTEALKKYAGDRMEIIVTDAENRQTYLNVKQIEAIAPPSFAALPIADIVKQSRAQIERSAQSIPNVKQKSQKTETVNRVIPTPQEQEARREKMIQEMNEYLNKKEQ